MQTPLGTTLVDHTFIFRGPEASQVFVVGSFNGWDSNATPMRKTRGGVFRVTLPLTPGRHEYKYVVDGDWRRDPECEEPDIVCPHCTENEFGTMNCVLNIPG